MMIYDIGLSKHCMVASKLFRDSYLVNTIERINELFGTNINFIDSKELKSMIVITRIVIGYIFNMKNKLVFHNYDSLKLLNYINTNLECGHITNLRITYNPDTDILGLNIYMVLNKSKHFYLNKKILLNKLRYLTVDEIIESINPILHDNTKDTYGSI